MAAIIARSSTPVTNDALFQLAGQVGRDRFPGGGPSVGYNVFLRPLDRYGVAMDGICHRPGRIDSCLVWRRAFHSAAGADLIQGHMPFG